MSHPQPLPNRRTTEFIKVDDLFIDHAVQREMIPARTKRLMAEFDPDSLGVLTVNRRDDATNSVVDGQHRAEMLRRLSFGDWKVKCDVYHELSLEDEARLWRRLNNTRRPTAYDDFKAALVEGDAEAVAINRITESFGITIGDQTRDGQVRCVNVLRQVYRGGRSNGVATHPEALAAALGVLVESWGSVAPALDGAVIYGLGLLFLRYGDEIDKQSLAQKLAKFPGGPHALIGRARGLRELRPGTVPQHLMAIVVDVYNSKRRVDRLEAA